MELKQIGTWEGLTTYFLPPNEPVKKVVCFLHGYAASPLRQPVIDRCLAMQIPSVGFALPQAPICLPNTEEGLTAFSWWKARYLKNSCENFSEQKPIELIERREQLLAWLMAIKTHFGLDSNQSLILAGYSQGAMLAADIAIFSQGELGGLLLFSGALINQAEWEATLLTSQPIPYFQSHGTFDETLPFSAGHKLHQLLQKAAWPGEFFAFPGVHETTKEVLFRAQQKITEWTHL